MKRGISTYRCDLRSRRTISNESRVPSDANNEQAKILPILPSMMRAYAVYDVVFSLVMWYREIFYFQESNKKYNLAASEHGGGSFFSLA